MAFSFCRLPRTLAGSKSFLLKTLLSAADHSPCESRGKKRRQVRDRRDGISAAHWLLIWPPLIIPKVRGGGGKRDATLPISCAGTPKRFHCFLIAANDRSVVAAIDKCQYLRSHSRSTRTNILHLSCCSTRGTTSPEAVMKPGPYQELQSVRWGRKVQRSTQKRGTADRKRRWVVVLRAEE